MSVRFNTDSSLKMRVLHWVPDLMTDTSPGMRALHWVPDSIKDTSHERRALNRVPDSITDTSPGMRVQHKVPNSIKYIFRGMRALHKVPDSQHKFTSTNMNFLVACGSLECVTKCPSRSSRLNCEWGHSWKLERAMGLAYLFVKMNKSGITIGDCS